MKIIIFKFEIILFVLLCLLGWPLDAVSWKVRVKKSSNSTTNANTTRLNTEEQDVGLPSAEEIRLASQPWEHVWRIKSEHQPRCELLHDLRVHKEAFRKAEAFLWELAREQLNIVNASTPHQKCTVARANKYKLFLESFGEVAVGVGLQNDAQKHYALYEAVWKAANDNIRANMLSKTWSDKEVEYYKEKRNFKQHHAFTFVREPVARFESAIREYFVRCPKELDLVSHHPMIENNSTTAVSEVSPAFIAAELDRILDTCNARHCSAFQFIPQRHMFPQSAMLTFWERKHMYPQFIGHLETFDQDWHAVDAHFGVEDHVYDKTLGGHESNTRFYGIKESLAQLFEEQPAYLRAVCILNFFDFHCFDYKFPPPCHGVQEQVLAFITDLLRPYAKPRRIAKVRIARPGDNNV